MNADPFQIFRIPVLKLDPFQYCTTKPLIALISTDSDADNVPESFRAIAIMIALEASAAENVPESVLVMKTLVCTDSVADIVPVSLANTLTGIAPAVSVPDSVPESEADLEITPEMEMDVDSVADRVPESEAVFVENVTMVPDSPPPAPNVPSPYGPSPYALL
jgi:hypothetical protein